MASFGNEGKSPVMMSEDAMYDDGVVMEAVVEKFVKYFKSIFHHNSWYFASFIFCRKKHESYQSFNSSTFQANFSTSDCCFSNFSRPTHSSTTSSSCTD